MMKRAVAVLAHVLFAVGLAGEGLTIALGAPKDPDLVTWQLPVVLLAVLTVVSGWILAWKRPQIAIGWLLLAIGVINAPSGPLGALGAALTNSDPVAAGWALTFGPQSQWIWIPGLGVLVMQLPLRFPSGQLPSPRWRPFFWYTVAALIASIGLAATIQLNVAAKVPNPVHVNWTQSDVVPNTLVGFLLASAAIGSIASVFVRYRRAEALEREQLRWLFWAVSIIVGWLIFEQIENAVFGDDGTAGVGGVVARVLDLVESLTYSLVPIAVLVGVLRYRLYAIDRIVSRTATYAVVSLAVLGVYGSIVLLVSILLPKLPSVGVAVATLAAAAVFLPLLRVLRKAIDRRFNRSQYDAERVVEQFGERVRNGADPHSAGSDLAAVVQRTLQPTTIGLWTPSDLQT